MCVWCNKDMNEEIGGGDLSENTEIFSDTLNWVNVTTETM